MFICGGRGAARVSLGDGLLASPFRQQGNFSFRAPEFFGRSIHLFGGAVPKVAGTVRVWPQVPSHAQPRSELQELLLAEVRGVLVVEQHEVAACLQRQHALAFQALVEDLENQIWKRSCS